MTLAAIPSPATSVWHIVGLPVRAYALCIVAGIVIACAVTESRLRRRGVAPWAVLDIAVWAVPFGIIGARLYHVITSPQAYFGDGGEPIKALRIWEGGLGIWGAVAGGALGVWFAARQLGIPFAVVADALAPGLPLAQAVGRFGNWFNNELYGGPTTLPWGLQVHRMDPDNPGRALTLGGEPVVVPGLYHPTFLYEALWNIGVAALVFSADRRFRFGRGRAFALYVMGYTAGRFWIELMRTDEANLILGVRVNVWVSVLVFLGALLYFIRVRGPQEFLVPATAPGAGGPVAVVDAAAVPAGVADAPAGDGAVGDGAVGDGTETATDETTAGEVATGAGARPVSGGPAARSPAAPHSYRVVDERQYDAYRATGVVPSPADDPAPVPDGGESDRPAEAGRDAARTTLASSSEAGVTVPDADDDGAGLTGGDLLDDFADDDPDDDALDSDGSDDDDVDGDGCVDTPTAARAEAVGDDRAQTPPGDGAQARSGARGDG